MLVAETLYLPWWLHPTPGALLPGSRKEGLRFPTFVEGTELAATAPRPVEEKDTGH